MLLAANQLVKNSSSSVHIANLQIQSCKNRGPTRDSRDRSSTKPSLYYHRQIGRGREIGPPEDGPRSSKFAEPGEEN